MNASLKLTLLQILWLSTKRETIPPHHQNRNVVVELIVEFGNQNVTFNCRSANRGPLPLMFF